MFCNVLIHERNSLSTRDKSQGAALLLVLRDWKYLGSYLLDNENMPTRIRGNRVEFPGMTKDRNFVPFSEAGPPRRVWLNGATREFTK